MTTYRRKCTRGLWLTAVSLMVVYVFVTTAVDLFHNHNDLVERDDCPACLWHQLSQDADVGPSAAEEVVAAFCANVFFSLPTDESVPEAYEAAKYQLIRAPPSC